MRGGSTVGIRAAAISATYFLVFYAARKLDVAPEEFEVLEPRPYGTADGEKIPLLQICVALVNGSGLCEKLSQPEPLTSGFTARRGSTYHSPSRNIRVFDQWICRRVP